jgi:hypothetical protein
LPYIPKAPAELAHLDDRTVARALSRRFGDVARAAEDLGVPRSALTRRTWHNPKLLTWAHERIDCFLAAVQSEIIDALESPRARRRQWAVDQLLGGGDHPLSVWAPARRGRGSRRSDGFVEAERARAAHEQEVAAERAAEQSAERERERALEEERAYVRAVRPPASPVAPAKSLWPAGVRRPRRGGW